MEVKYWVDGVERLGVEGTTGSKGGGSKDWGQNQDYAVMEREKV